MSQMKRSLLIGLVLIALSQTVYGQGCSVCTKNAEGLDDKSAKGLNGGIIYLAFLPIAIMGTLGFVWWKHNRTPNS
jgi:hypothetical protein